MASNSADVFKVAQMPLPEAIDAIRKGLPARSFDAIAASLSSVFTAEQVASKLGISIRTLNDQRKKVARLSRENSEKIVRVARIQRLAREVFTADAAVSEWLDTPAPALDGARPIDLLDTDLGTREVESVLQGIAYGNVM
jgi:putative toxin-antitoxin system antitoxin component (TIGR02293 family)